MALADTRSGIDLGTRLTPGTVLASRYRIERLVGMGGMGVVYQAHDLEIGADVALKVLRPEFGADPQWIARFRRELALARQVTHRNVVRIHDIAESDGLRFLTMVFVPGRSLGEVLASDGPLPGPRALFILRQLAEALQEAHAAGVVHRDLKPANILVAEGDVAYVTDFGVAKSLVGDGLTRAGAVVGTPEYLSPEQVAGDPVDARSDVYALGLVLFEMLSGELPFQGGSQAEMLAQRLTGRGRDVTQTGARVSPPVRRIVRRCLERDPARRYASAGDLQRDVEAALRGGPLSRGLPRVDPRLALLAGAVLLAAAAVFWISRRVDTPDEPRAPTSAAVPAAVTGTALLPLADESADPSLAWMSTGIPEMLSAQLAEAPELRILDPLRVMRTLRDLQLGPAQAVEAGTLRRVAELLDATRVVTGTVRRAGSALRIDLRLSTPASGQAATLSVEAATAEGLFAAVATLGERLRTELGASPAPTAAPPETSSLEAARDYQAGRARLATGDSLGALPHLVSAVAKDPGFAAAHERLSEAHQALGRQGEATRSAERAAEHAGAGEGRLGLRIAARLALLKGDPAGAEKRYQDLARRYPNDAEALLDLAAAQGAQGHIEAAVNTLQQATAKDKGDPRAWFLLGKNMIMMGEARRAVGDPLVKALALQQQLRNEQGQADVENAMGVGHHQLGEYPQAIARYSAAYAIRQRLNDERGMATSLKNRARVQVATGHPDAAEPDLARAAALFQKLGDAAGRADILNDQGVLHEGRGDYPQARAAYQEALKIRRNLGDERQLAQSYDNLGYIFFLEGEYDSALVYWKQALERRTAIGDKGGIVLSTQNLGFLATAQGRGAEAMKHFLTALEQSRAIDFKSATAVSLGNIGILHHIEGRHAAALSGFAEALTVFREIDDARGQAEFLLKDAAVQLDLHRLPEADARLREAEPLVRKAASREQGADALALRGEWHLRQGSGAEARAGFEQAVDLARQTKSRTAILRARVSSAAGRERLGEGDPTAVAALLREAEDIGDVLLQVRAGEALARLQLRRGRAGPAREQATRTVDAARAAGWGSGLYRLHGLQARALLASGDPAGAARAHAAAASETARLRAALGDLGASFAQHPDVLEATAPLSGPRAAR